MRYFFAFLGVMIVVRAFAWLVKDRRIKRRRLKTLPDAGTIGILTVEQGGRHLQPGAAISVPYEGVLGCLRTCDIVVPVEDVATLHLDFTFAAGKGLYIYPRRGCEAVVDGIPLTNRRESRMYPMQHGSVLEVGQAVLRLGVFEGLDVPEVTSWAMVGEFTQEPVPEAPGQNWPPQQGDWPIWQQASYPPPCAPPQQSPCSPVNDPWQGGDDRAP